jgi:hypothetical protein
MDFWKGIALPKQNLKAMQYLYESNLYTLRIELFWSRLLEGYCLCPKLLNACAIPLLGYIKNCLGSITYLLKLEGVLHNHTKTYKESNTLFRVICKRHGFTYFGLGYRRGIVHA